MAMDLWSYLLAKVAEEAGEIAQQAGKCASYGPLDNDPRDAISHTNIDKLVGEVNDLLGVLSMLRSSVRYYPTTPAGRDYLYKAFECLNDPAPLYAKKLRVAHWAQHSVANGIISTETLKQLQALACENAVGLSERSDES